MEKMQEERTALKLMFDKLGDHYSREGLMDKCAHREHLMANIHIVYPGDGEQCLFSGENYLRALIDMLYPLHGILMGGNFTDTESKYLTKIEKAITGQLIE